MRPPEYASHCKDKLAKFRSDLPVILQYHDPSLHEALTGVGTSGQPDIAALERTVSLPGASFFRDIVPDSVTERKQWSQDLLAASQGHDLVFFDPDNGFEIKSKPIGRTGSSKFVAWAEVEAPVANGQSALVYQHYPRVPRPRFAADLLEQIARRSRCETAVAFHTAHVLFLLAAAPHHRQVLETPGVLGIVMQGARPDSYLGAIIVNVEPSRDFHPGVHFLVNDHYETTGKEQGCGEAMETLAARWVDSMAMSVGIMHTLREGMG